ncbi:MAG: metallophosphoesterase [Bacteriovoracaceae bacterium]
MSKVKINRNLFIGDVHGCFDELLDLLKKLKYNSNKDCLYFVGDLINKGPKNFEVLKWIMRQQAEGKEVYSVLGNHDWAFYRYATRTQDERKFNNLYFNKLIEKLGEELSDAVNWIEQLPLYIETSDFIVVHAGVAPGIRLKDHPRQILTLIRTWDGGEGDFSSLDNPSWFDLYKGEKLIVYGHWAANGLNQRKNTIGLDSGCVYGGQLSALILPDREVVSVPAKKDYSPILT